MCGQQAVKSCMHHLPSFSSQVIQGIPKMQLIIVGSLAEDGVTVCEQCAQYFLHKSVAYGSSIASFPAYCCAGCFHSGRGPKACNGERFAINCQLTFRTGGGGGLLGTADAQTAHPATSSTAPAHQLLGSASAETTPAGAPAAAADRTSTMRREERVTGPRKETTTRRNVTLGEGGDFVWGQLCGENFAFQIGDAQLDSWLTVAVPGRVASPISGSL